MDKNVCPYKFSGICYRKGCLYLPNQTCMKIGEYKHRLQIAKNLSKKKKTTVKQFKKVN